MGRPSARAERDRLRGDLLAAGRSLPEVAAAMQERFRVRRRTAWRYALGWPQWKVVQEFRSANPGLPIAESRVSEWEAWPHGGTRPTLEVLAALAETFGHGCSVADLIDDVDLAAMPPAQRSLVTATRGPVAPPPAAPKPTTIATVRQHAMTMESFRTADRQVGGGHLYPAVAAYLGSAVARDLLDVAADVGPVFTAAAALSEMAGWMAHDGGDDALASRHFARAVRLAETSGDNQVLAHLLASSAHLALSRDDPHRASALARRGLDAVGPGGPTAIRARLLAMQARSGGAVGDRRTAVAALSSAQAAIGKDRSVPVSPWVSQFDDASLAMEAARAHRAVGDLRAAYEHAEQVVALRPASRARARALGRLAVADVHLARGQADQAAEIVVEVVRDTGHLQSHVVVRQLRDLSDRLAATGAGGPVREASALVRAQTPSAPPTLTLGAP